MNDNYILLAKARDTWKKIEKYYELKFGEVLG